LRSRLDGCRPAAIRQVMADDAHATGPPGVATWARGDVASGSIRQVMADDAPATERPGVATRARGDVGDDRRYGRRRLAAIRQVMADAPGSHSGPTSRRGHGAM
jgi:hypothetical protein